MSVKEYNDLQVQEINTYKWIMSERAGYDLGNNAVLDWIKLYAHVFRETKGSVELKY